MPHGMVAIVLSLILVGFAIGCPMTAVMRSLGHRLGALDSPGAKGHAKVLRPIPNTGGVAIFFAVAIPLLAGAVALFVLPGERMSNLVPAIESHLPRLRESLPTAIALLACLTLLHIVGVVDDRRSLGPLLKIAVQIACALVLAAWFDVRLLELLDDYVPGASVLITVMWIVAITNAINFLDNMDGLAGGVSAIAASFLLAATLINSQWFVAAMLALLIGGLLGFLVFNFPPARIFMGDGGSLVIGFLLAVLTARTTFLHESLGSAWYSVFMPVIILAIPLYDFTSVTLIRLKQGKSPFVGDQQHFSHRLVQRGLSKRGAVIVIWCFAAVTGVGGVSLGRLEPWQAALVFLQTVLVLVTIAILEHASRRAVK
jgi:UDP-GlcNAc:undecaprenyl-phosphate GlcNAc-1-phosphate transferase